MYKGWQGLKLRAGMGIISHGASIDVHHISHIWNLTIADRAHMRHVLDMAFGFTHLWNLSLIQVGIFVCVEMHAIRLITKT